MGGKYPNILKPKVVPLTRPPSSWKTVTKKGHDRDGNWEYREIDVQTAMTIMKMCKEFNNDIIRFCGIDKIVG